MVVCLDLLLLAVVVWMSADIHIAAQALPQMSPQAGAGAGGAGSQGGWPGESESMMGGGRERAFGQRPIGGLTEKVEGCFDRFDSEFAMELGRENLSNKRCQAICTDHGYALSATGLSDSCFCGNDYPSVFRRVDTGQCDLPCNPDKASCFAFTCCGSRDGRFFTVSWSGEMDILKQLLRQLSHDYRFNSPTFRNKIEGDGFCDNVALRLGPSPVNRDSDPTKHDDGESDGEHGHHPHHGKVWMEPDAPPLFLSVGNGCPVGWSLHDCWCYRQHWAEPSTYNEACAKCHAENGELVTITSEGENHFVQNMHSGCQGWMGIKQQVVVVDEGTGPARRLALLDEATQPKHLAKSGVDLWSPLSNAGTISFPDQTVLLSPPPPTHTAHNGSVQDSSHRHSHARKRRHHKRAFWDRGAKFHRWANSTTLNAALVSPLSSFSVKEDSMVKTPWVGRFYDLQQQLGTMNEDEGTNSSSVHSFFDEVEGLEAAKTDNQGVHRIHLSYDNFGFRFIRPAAAGDTTHVPLSRVSSSAREVTVELPPEERLVGIKAVFGVLGLRSLGFYTLALGEKVDSIRLHGPFGNLLLDRPDFFTKELWLDGMRWHHPIVGFYGHTDATTGYVQSLGFYQRLLKDCAWMDGTGNWTAVDCFHVPQNATSFVCQKKGWLTHLGCPDGWLRFSDSCYLRRRLHSISWWDAWAHCQTKMGGHLVSLDSAADNAFVNSLLGKRGGYIGYHRHRPSDFLMYHRDDRDALGLEGWIWDTYWNIDAPRKMHSEDDDVDSWFAGSNGSTSLASTLPGDESDAQQQQQCFEMTQDGTWTVVAPSCLATKSRAVLCEVGSNDASCSCPSPPLKGHGNASDHPVRADNSGFYLQFGCSCYRREVVQNMSWVGAQKMCGSWGGRLVVIDSKEENEWVLAQFQDSMTFNNGFLPGFIGLNNLLNGEEYDWSYYENWQHSTSPSLQPLLESTTDKTPLEPTPYVSTITCAQMARDGSWVAKNCDKDERASCFVCKKPRAASYPAIRPYEDEQWAIAVVEPNGRRNNNNNNNNKNNNDDDDDGSNGNHRNNSDSATNSNVNADQGPTSCAYPWCRDCFDAYLRNINTNEYICVDDQNRLFLSWNRDPAWCLLTIVMHGDSGAVALLTPHGAGLFYDEQEGGLVVRFLPPVVDMSQQAHPFHKHFNKAEQSQPGPQPNVLTPPSDPRPWVNSVFSVDGIACFYPSRPIRSIAWRYLRINILARSRDLDQPGVKECSIAVYDQTPHTESFRCWRRPMSGFGTDDLVYLEQEALLFFDQSTFAAPRIPLPNGRVRCENQSPTETATCTFAYGQGLTLSRQFRANWGYTISDVVTHRVNANPAQSALFRVPPPAKRQEKQKWHDEQDHENRKRLFKRHNKHVHDKSEAEPLPRDLTLSISELKEFQNAFSVAYTNFYEILIVKSYVETRNWQLSVPVAPRTSDTIQFWLSSENLRYRWRALFAARGGFTITSGGVPIGDHHSLGDVSYFRDLFFFVFGTYEFPYEAEIIITVNDVPGDGWPLPLPEQSQGDRIRDVTRNGQFGFGYGPR
eukprot:evm.model.NODE_11720_length_31253_cov_26.129396.6